MTDTPDNDHGNDPQPGWPKMAWAVLITLITVLSCVMIIKQGLETGMFNF
ncbi:hypothetical protein KRX51_07515 [Corynebacterium sp. TAE3-ERU12]|nr:hypothetical protein [Corynebacterium sp. TAE3-ERU12]MBV7295761.1 hypothetical protein [Corynebacterium sp. TAE3-ERU12]